MKKIVEILIAFIIIIIVTLAIIKNSDDKNYEIEEVKDFYYFKLYVNEKYGVIDTSGNILVPAKYDILEIPNPSKPVFIGYLNYDEEKLETEVINDKNEKIIETYSRGRTY